MLKSDLYLLDEPEGCRCDRCGVEVSDESELFPYYDIYVCEDCYDKLSLRDEKEILAYEDDGLNDYEE